MNNLLSSRAAMPALVLLGLCLLPGCDRKENRSVDRPAAAEAGRDHPGRQTAAEGAGGASREVKPVAAQAVEAPRGLSCDAHGAPAADCWICDASLRDPGRLWCREHGTYEDRCWLCHPELEDESRLYCREHGVYEDECFLCHPELKKAGNSGGGGDAPAPSGGEPEAGMRGAAGKQAVAGSAEKGRDKGLFCREHDLPEAECGICHPDLLAGLEPGQGMKVRFASKESAAKAGVETGRPEPVSGSTGAHYLGRLTYNENRTAQIMPRATGTLARVLADYGDEVRAGQALGTIASPEAAEAKAAFVNALSDSALKKARLRREEELTARKVSARQELETAQAEFRQSRSRVAAARQRLLNQGMSPREVSELERTQDVSSELILRAPFSGVVTARQGVPGERVLPDAPLFTVADLSTMWMEINVPADRAAGLARGIKVVVGFDGLGRVKLPGTVVWVAPEVDGLTRMLRVRAEVPNPGRRLKSGMLGRAGFVLPDAPGENGAVGIPGGAVQRIAGEPYVFVRLEDDLFEARRVALQGRDDLRAYVTAGLSRNESIVTAGSYTVRSELFKSRLGAGCVGEH